MNIRRGRGIVIGLAGIVGLLLLSVVARAALATPDTVPAGARPGGVTLISASYTIRQSDCGKTVAVRGGPHTVTLPAGTGFPSACSISVCNRNANASGQHAVLLDSFPAPLARRLYMQQCAGVAMENGAWQVTDLPGRFRPKFTPEFYVDNGGSDENDGLVSNAAGNALATPQGCIARLQLDYDLVTRRPICELTGGQTFTGGVRLVGPVAGTSVMYLAGSGGTAVIRPAPGGNAAMLLGDFAPYVITRNITYDCTTGSAGCVAFMMHQQTGVDLNAGTTLAGSADTQKGLVCDSLCKVNEASDGIRPVTLSGTLGTGFSGNLGSQLAFSRGIAIADDTTIAGSLLSLSGSSSIAFSGVLSAGTHVSIAEIFTLRMASTACIANFTTEGAFGGARQFSVLNGSVLVNTSAVAVPGSSPGFVTFPGYAPGLAPDRSGGNTGVDAGGC